MLPTQFPHPERVVTYSPAYTIVPTYECFNRCTYCNFRVDPGKDEWIALTSTNIKLRKLKSQSVSEILILSGEVHPQSPRRSRWFDHIYNLCELALSLEFLPHTNAGPLSVKEMAQLKTVNASMGLMLEQMTPELLKTVHRHAPSKDPELRLQQLEWAGQLQIPFTTGLLLGIGESAQDRLETLEAIAAVHQRWGHIQEVILQPHSPGQTQAWQGKAFDLPELVEVVRSARRILPDPIVLQIPPNLIAEREILLACLDAGVRDLGGIVPIDEVNPDYSHLSHAALAAVLKDAGWELRPRLPVYPQYDRWLPESLQAAVRKWRSLIADRHNFRA